MRRALHDLDAAFAIGLSDVTLAANSDRLAVACFIGPTPLIAIVAIDPIGRVGTRSHNAAPRAPLKGRERGCMTILLGRGHTPSTQPSRLVRNLG